RVDRAVLVSATPGIEDERERAARRASDDALAERLERDGITSFVDAWEQQPLLRLDERVPHAVLDRQRAERLASSPRGLANSLRGVGTGQQPPLWHALPDLRAPVSLVVGERDPRYRAIAERMQALLPCAALSVCPGAG